MSKLFVDQVDPKTATTLTLGTSGDTISIPSGVTIANAGTATGFGGFVASDITGQTALGQEPAQTDELVLSDAGALKRADFSHIMPVPMILLTRTSNITVATSTATKVTWDTPIKQQGGTWDGTNYRFTPGVAGYYNSQCIIRWNNFIPESKQGGPQLYKNGAHFYTYGSMQNFRSDQTTLSGSDVMMTHPIYLDDDDYLEMYVWHNAGTSGAFGGGYNHWLVYRLVGMST